MRLTVYRPDGTPWNTVDCDDSSACREEVCEGRTFRVRFSLDRYDDEDNVRVGCWLEYCHVRYTMYQEATITMEDERNYAYDCTFEGRQGALRLKMFKNPQDGRISWKATGKCSDFLRMLTECLNGVEPPAPGVGGQGGATSQPAAPPVRWDFTNTKETEDQADQTLEFDCVDCLTALRSIAEAFGTEWNVEEEDAAGVSWVRLGRLEAREADGAAKPPIEMDYGRTAGGESRGILGGIVRTPIEGTQPVHRLYVEGGVVDEWARDVCGSDKVHLPGHEYTGGGIYDPATNTGGVLFDGLRFEEEAGFDAEEARRYNVASGYVEDVGHAEGIEAAVKFEDVKGPERELEVFRVPEGRVGVVDGPDSVGVRVDFVGEPLRFTSYVSARFVDPEFAEEGILVKTGNEKNLHYILIQGQRIFPASIDFLVDRTGEWSSRIKPGDKFTVEGNYKPLKMSYFNSWNPLPEDCDILGVIYDRGVKKYIVQIRYKTGTHCQGTADIPANGIRPPRSGVEHDLLRKALSWLYKRNSGGGYSYKFDVDPLWLEGREIEPYSTIELSGHDFLKKGGKMRIKGVKRFGRVEVEL